MTCNNNKVMVAAAGSGKTTFLIEESLKITKHPVLITTFTEANKDEIKKKIHEQSKYIPSNITVQTWFSFLLQHGVRPYQDYLFSELSKKPINSIHWVDSARDHKEENNKQHYINNKNQIYSNKIAKFAVKCDEKSKGSIIDRLSRIYPSIFIDEAQDLAGYDLDFLKLLFNSSIHVTLVCDPRQGTYSTNNSQKNKQYRKEKIIDFLKKLPNIEIDSKLNKNYRSVSEICLFSDKLYPEYQPTESGNNEENQHRGVFLVRKEDVNEYLNLYKPIQLRDSRKKILKNNFDVMNFGESKGLSFDRTLIYPTQPIENWLKDNKEELPAISKAKFYVAITRARFSVGIVYDYKNDETIQDTKKFTP